MATCKGCGQEFNVEPTGHRPREYCSLECQAKARSRTLSQRAKLARQGLDPHITPEEFREQKRAQMQAYRDKKRNENPLKVECPICHQVFIKPRDSRDRLKYCSDECKRKARALREAQYRKERKEGIR